MYHRTRTRAVEVLVGLAVVYGVIFHTNLVWWAAEPLRISEPPRPADAIVVFAGGVGESAKAGGGTPERLKEAVELYKAGRAPYLIFSSGYAYSFLEAQQMRAQAIGQGVPASAIVLEEHSVNTFQNVTFVNEILREHHWRTILLVSSPYHMRRATLVWRKAAPDVTVIHTPPSRSQFYDHSRGATVEQVGGILYEYIAILAYWRRGWL